MMYLFSRRTPLSLSCTRNLAIQSGEKWPASRPSCGYSSFLRHSSVISSYNNMHIHTYTPAPAAGTAAPSDTPQLSAPTTAYIHTYTPAPAAGTAASSDTPQSSAPTTAASSDTPQLSAPTTAYIHTYTPAPACSSFLRHSSVISSYNTYTPHSTCIYMIILNHYESRM